MLVWILAQILIVLLMAVSGGAAFCAASLRRRLLRLEEETERAFDSLRGEMEGLRRSGAEQVDEEEEKKARAAERLFTEGLANILGYDFASRENERV